LPLLKTSVVTPTAIAKLTSMLEDSLAERTLMHAVLMDILGLGVLIVGESGIGKSECALDLIVRAGGFGVAALDVADVPSRYLCALPWTTWLRLAHANEGRDTVCLLVGDAPMGKSARGTSVRLDATHQWTGTSAQSRRFGGIEIRAGAGRSVLSAGNDLLSCR
jgi:hypothetical protein